MSEERERGAGAARETMKNAGGEGMKQKMARMDTTKPHISSK